jgi:hypothetical protein
MLVVAAASLINFVIQAVLIMASWSGPCGAWRRKDTFVPGVLQYTISIVLIGTLLMAGHFLEVMVWAVTYALVGVGPTGIDLINLRVRQRYDARL